MKENDILRAQIFEIVNNQLKNNDPPETKITYERLKSEGYDDYTIKQMIGSCVAVEIFEVLKYGKEFNADRYARNLNKLPEEPYDDDETV